MPDISPTPISNVQPRVPTKISGMTSFDWFQHDWEVYMGGDYSAGLDTLRFAFSRHRDWDHVQELLALHRQLTKEQKPLFYIALSDAVKTLPKDKGLTIIVSASLDMQYFGILDAVIDRLSRENIPDLWYSLGFILDECNNTELIKRGLDFALSQDFPMEISATITICMVRCKAEDAFPGVLEALKPKFMQQWAVLSRSEPGKQNFLKDLGGYKDVVLELLDIDI